MEKKPVIASSYIKPVVASVYEKFEATNWSQSYLRFTADPDEIFAPDRTRARELEESLNIKITRITVITTSLPRSDYELSSIYVYEWQAGPWPLEPGRTPIAVDSNFGSRTYLLEEVGHKRVVRVSDSGSGYFTSYGIFA